MRYIASALPAKQLLIIEKNSLADNACPWQKEIYNAPKESM